MSGKNRAVQVATVSQDYLLEPQQKGMLGDTLDRLEASACCQPDIVCLPEVFTGSEPETVPGPMTERLSQWAKAKSAYVVCPMMTLVGRQKHNSAVIIDRAGTIIGQYHKTHPTEGELDSGIAPGSSAPVFETDFGKIGIQICFDVNWHEVWHSLKAKGAEIVFFPAAFPAHRMLSTLAWLNEYYVVSSTRTRPSRIYDISGEVMAASGMFQPWAQATLHLSKRLFEIDYHTSKMKQLQQRYGRRVLVQWCHDDDRFTLASLDPELSVEQLIEEFELVPLREYLVRAGRVIDTARGAPGDW
jgi:predicted amidohydrolase